MKNKAVTPKTGERFDQAQNVNELFVKLENVLNSLDYVNKKANKQAALKFISDLKNGVYANPVSDNGKIIYPAGVDQIVFDILSPAADDGTRANVNIQTLEDVTDPVKLQAALNDFQNNSNQSGLEAELAQAKKNWGEAQTRAYNNQVLLDKEQQKAQTLFKKQQGFKRALIGVSIAAIASLGILAATHLFGWKKDKVTEYDKGYTDGQNSVDITIDNEDIYEQGVKDGEAKVVLELPDFPRLEGESDADYLQRWKESDNTPLTIDGFDRLEGESDTDYLKRWKESDNQDTYDKGYQEGQNSVDITTDNQDAYDKGYKEGQDSVDITVDNKDAYDKGYSDGQNSGNNYSTNGTGAAVEQGEGSVTPVSAGDDENTNTGENFGEQLLDDEEENGSGMHR